MEELKRMDKSILIISFAFPPSPSIGGRRWSFFADYLFRKGVDVHIIASDFEKDLKNCPWIKSLNNIEDKVVYLKHKTPFHILNPIPQSFLGKLKYKFSTYRVNKIINHSLHDRSIYFAADALEKAILMIKKYNIKNVVVSGGPFYLLYKTTQLKEVFGDEINLMVDIRDPWSEHWGLEPKDESKKVQRIINEHTYQKIDKILVVNDKMKKDIHKVWPNLKKEVIVLPHAYDDDLFEGKLSDKGLYKKMFYAGSFYKKRTKEYKLLNQLITKENIELDIYINKNDEFNPFDKNDSISFNNTLNQETLFNLVSNHGLTFYITYNDDFPTTKFYELVKLGKFILYFGKKGAVSDLINNENLGFTIISDEVEEISDNILKEIRLQFEAFQPNLSFVGSYSFSNVTQKVIEVLI